MMTLDASKDGVTGKLVIWGTLIAIVIGLLGGVYRAGEAIQSIENQLDRNCRIIVGLDTDTRVLVLLHVERIQSSREEELIEKALAVNSSEKC